MIRRLSPMEQLFWYFAQNSPVNFTTTIRVQGEFTLSDLKDALNRVCVRHPILKSRIEGGVIDGETSEYPYFTTEGAPDHPIRIVNDGHPESWIQETKKELNIPFASRVEPLTRFVWIQGEDFSDIMMVCHHIIADGLATMYVFHDLFTALADPSISWEPLPDYGGMDDLIPVDSADESLMNQFKTENPVVPETVDAPSQFVAEEKENFHITSWKVDKETTAKIVASSRENGTTVQGTLAASVLRTFIALDRESNKPTRRILTPINLRSYLTKPVGEIFGCFVSLIKTDVNCSPEIGFWDMARNIKKQLIEAAVPKRLFAPSLALKRVSDECDQFEDFLKESVRVDISKTYSVDFEFSLSNLGRVDLQKRYGSLELTSIFGPTFSAEENEIVIGVLTFDDELYFNLISNNRNIDLDMIDKIKQSSMELLLQAIG